jgi:hypothetical protein
MKFLSAILLQFVAFSAGAQRNADKGDRYFNINQFETAIKYYLMDAGSKNKKTSEYAMQKLADCYRITGEFEKAEETYRKTLKKKKKDPINYLNYGLSLKSSAKYAEAKLQLEEYIKLKPEDPMGNIYLQSCDSAQKWLDETIGKEVKSLDRINTEYSEFSPFILNNHLYFSSSRTGSKQALISFDGGGEVHRLDLYAIDFNNIDKKEINKTDVINFKEINTPAHEGAACFSKDGKELFFTKTVKGKRNEKTNDILNTLQVFYSKVDSTGKWTVPESAFSFNSYKYSVAHPSLSADEKTIYFMSDMPGGFGKTDIYSSTKKANGSWGAPKNLGNTVNTFGYEMFPYISTSGILYFSSNAHPGMGQLDVFQATYNDGKWGNVINMKPPINSIGNDFGIVLDGANHRGFFSSDRFNGKGAEDIYSFADESPLTLNFIGDTLQFFDKSIFDELKYKITNEQNKSEAELSPVNGIFKVKLEKGAPYKLIARKNGMLFNKVFFTYNNQNNLSDLSIKTASKPILLDGEFDFSKEAILNTGSLTITDTSGITKPVYLKSYGYFNINDTLKTNIVYHITTKLSDISEPTANDTIKHEPILIKGKILGNNKPLSKAQIIIREENKTIVALSASMNGEFNCYLILKYPQKYVMEISSEGYTTKTVDLIFQEGELILEMDVELLK